MTMSPVYFHMLQWQSRFMSSKMTLKLLFSLSKRPHELLGCWMSKTWSIYLGLHKYSDFWLQVPLYPGGKAQIQQLCRYFCWACTGSIIKYDRGHTLSFHRHQLFSKVSLAEVHESSSSYPGQYVSASIVLFLKHSVNGFTISVSIFRETLHFVSTVFN